MIGWLKFQDSFHLYSLKKEKCQPAGELVSARQAACGKLENEATRHLDFDMWRRCLASQAILPHH